MGLDVKRVLSMLVLATAAAVVVSLGSSAVAGSENVLLAQSNTVRRL